jgi:hypothetical protein
LVLLVVIWRIWGWRAVLISTVVVGLVCLATLGGLYTLSPEFTRASLQAQFAKSSWQTVWALVDGNVSNTGSFGPLAQRFSPEAALTPLHNPARVPAWLSVLPLLGLGIFVATRPVRSCGRHGPILAALLIVLFFLWSKGWSPQWQLILIPLLLLALPPGRAVMFILVLGFVNLLEWPVILSRGLTQLLPLTIVLRTAILALLGWELYRQLIAWPNDAPLAPGHQEPSSAQATACS